MIYIICVVFLGEFSLKKELITYFIDLSNVCVVVFTCIAYKTQDL